MKKVVVIGASGHGKVIADILEQSNHFEILGFLDSEKAAGTKVLSYEVLGSEKLLSTLLEQEEGLGGIIGIGDNWQRKEMATKILEVHPGFRFVNAIHPKAVVSAHANIGSGVVIVGGAIINPGAIIGNHCIVNTKASVGHDCELQEYSSIAPGATLGGNVNLGPMSVISLGCSIRNNIRIGAHTVIGAGSYVHSDLESQIVAYGNPAKFVRKREPWDPYL